VVAGQGSDPHTVLIMPGSRVRVPPLLFRKPLIRIGLAAFGFSAASGILVGRGWCPVLSTAHSFGLGGTAPSIRRPSLPTDQTAKHRMAAGRSDMRALINRPPATPALEAHS
jgi:hypothetical protein